MARGTLVSALLSMLKGEIGDFAGTNAVRDAELIQLLSNKQKWLATEYEWPFLEQRWDQDVGIGTQFVALPTTDAESDTTAINMERFPKLEVLWNNVYQPVEYGIGADEYNTLNFSLGQSSDPIQRWRVATNPNEPTNQNEFEVWPVPLTTQTLRFTGQRTLLPLAATTDTADLDDMLLVYFVAGERLMRSKQADAQMKLQMAQRRLAWVRQNYPTRDKRRCLSGSEDYMFKRDRHLIAIAGPAQDVYVPDA